MAKFREHRYWIMQTPDEIAIGFKDGQIERYKIANDEVLYQPRREAPWERLSPEQTLQHLAIDTVVAEWLKHRVGRNQRRGSKLPELAKRAA
jgi:hypothetical protein